MLNFITLCLFIHKLYNIKTKDSRNYESPCIYLHPCLRLSLLEIKHFRVQLPTSAEDVTLLAFAAVCHAAYPAAPIDRYLCRRVVQQLIDIACLRGPQQQTRRTLLQRPIDGTDRWTDTVPLHRLSHTVRAVLKSRQRDRQRERPTEHAISLINES